MKQKLRPCQRMAAPEVGAALKSKSIRRAAGLTLYCRENALSYPRLALIVPKKAVPGAVERNRIRRLIREAFRLHQAKLQGLDCVLRWSRDRGTPPPSLDEISQLLLRAAE